MYAGVLLGTIVLAGCNVNEESQKQESGEMTAGFIDSPTIELPPLEPLSSEEIRELEELEEQYYSELEVEVDELSYEEIVMENPSIAEIKTMEQLDKKYNLQTITEVPEGVVPMEFDSIEEAIEYFEWEKRYQEKNQ